MLRPARSQLGRKDRISRSSWRADDCELTHDVYLHRAPTSTTNTEPGKNYRVSAFTHAHVKRHALASETTLGAFVSTHLIVPRCFTDVDVSSFRVSRLVYTSGTQKWLR